MKVKSTQTVIHTLSTGETVKRYYADENSFVFTVIVKGDIDGDAKVNSSDFMQARYAFLGINELSEIEFMAADVNDDGKVNSTDFMQIRKHFLSQYEIYADKKPVYDERIETWISRLSANAEHAKGLVVGNTYNYGIQYDDTEKDVSLYPQILKDNNTTEITVQTMHSGFDGYTVTDADFINRAVNIFAAMDLAEMTEEEYAQYMENRKCYADENGNLCSEGEGELTYYGRIDAEIDFTGDKKLEGYTVTLIKNNPDIYNCNIMVTCFDKHYKITNVDKISDELYDFLAIVEIAF